MKFPLSSSCAVFLISLPLLAHAQRPVGEVYATDATVKGSVLLAGGGTKLMSGSSVTAGDAAAVLRLSRGGEVRVCSRTSISVTASPNGRDLLLGMGTGDIETHYQLGSSTDSILTPDFKIQLSGPGEFHVAIGSDPRGNTCVRSLPANTASVIVTELMGDGTYQVKPGEQVRFAHGQISGASADAGDCGCPAPPPTILKTEAPAPAETKKVETAAVAQATTPQPQPEVTASLPPPSPGQVHVQFDAPFVFSGAGAVPPPPSLLRLDLSTVPVMLPAVGPPPAVPVPAPEVAKTEKRKQEKRGFFGRVRGFFASVFGG